MADLVSDIVGRVNRLPLKPSETNALLPLMEAFSNALHAVNLRFGDQCRSFHAWDFAEAESRRLYGPS